MAQTKHYKVFNIISCQRKASQNLHGVHVTPARMAHIEDGERWSADDAMELGGA